jgi:hypothetical protein
VPATTRRIDDVAFARRLLAVVAVDVAVALEDDEELVAVRVQVALMPRARLEHGPADDVIGSGRLLVDQELHLHVDPALVLAQPFDQRHVANVGAVLLGHGCPPRRR